MNHYYFVFPFGKDAKNYKNLSDRKFRTAFGALLEMMKEYRKNGGDVVFDLTEHTKESEFSEVYDCIKTYKF